MNSDTMTTWEVLVGVWAAPDGTGDAQGPVVPRAIREAVLRGGLVEPVDAEHFVAVPLVVHGLTLYHRLTTTERNRDLLAVDPDLAPLREPAAMGARLPTGEPLRLEGVTDHWLAGPPGWLEPYEAGTLLAVRLHHAQVLVAEAEAEPPASSAGVDALVEAADRLLRTAAVQGEHMVEIRRVVWGALALGREDLAELPYLVEQPVPPLGDVFSRAGFGCSGEWLHRR